MSKVFVLDQEKRPLEPVHPGRARCLLTAGQAAVYRIYPFTIILKRQVEQPVPAPLRLKIDPGAKTTGLALVHDATGEVVWAAEVAHRGAEIRSALDTRRAVRHGRRQRKTRYRSPRFANRHRHTGWLPPSLQSRVENIMSWVSRLSRLCHITALSQELVRFDLQKLEHPEMSSIEYQYGELFGYEIREYVLEKWERKCAYCDKQGVPLQIEHIQPKARGGTDRVANLTLACEECNQAKGTQDVRDFLRQQPERLSRILSQAKALLKDATAVNATRWELFRRLQATGMPVEIGSGGCTKYNRIQRNLPKTHWCDAACIGASTPEVLQTAQVVPLLIEACGRGHRCIMLPDPHGFPRSYRKRRKRYFGYQTGDLVRAVVPQGARKGTHVGRVAVKANGYFTIQTKTGKVTDVAHRYCHMRQRTDGYDYRFGEKLSPPPTSPKGAPVSFPASKAEVPTGEKFMEHGSSVSSGADTVQSDCTFCQLNGIARYLLKETASFRLIADHAPLVAGHLLIIPKGHYTCYGDVPAALDEELLTLRREAEQFLTRFYAPVVFWEHGIFRQTVFHAHLHCFPFGNIEYQLPEDLHEITVNSRDDVRAWHAAHGHYFYLEDRRRALLFAAEMESYLRVIQEVLWPGAVARNGSASWRSPQQRQQEGVPLIQDLLTNWRIFQQEGETCDNQSCTR